MKSLDHIDFRILELLQQDAKATIKEIASTLGMTTTPVYERIKKMEESGFIRRYVAILDKEKLGLHTTAFCHVSLQEHARDTIQDFQQKIGALEEVQECYHIAGTYDYLLKVVVSDMTSYHDFIVNKLATLPNIGQVQSAFVMSEIKASTNLLLDS